MLCSYPIELKLCRIVKYTKQVMNIPLFLTFAHILGRQLTCFMIWQNFIIGYITDTVQVRICKLCVIITLLGVSQFIPGLMTLALFQGHRVSELWTANFVLDFCPQQFKYCMGLTYINKIRHSMLCVSGAWRYNWHYFFNYPLEWESSERLLFLL